MKIWRKILIGAMIFYMSIAIIGCGNLENTQTENIELKLAYHLPLDHHLSKKMFS